MYSFPPSPLVPPSPPLASFLPPLPPALPPLNLYPPPPPLPSPPITTSTPPSPPPSPTTTTPPQLPNHAPPHHQPSAPYTGETCTLKLETGTPAHCVFSI